MSASRARLGLSVVSILSVLAPAAFAQVTFTAVAQTELKVLAGADTDSIPAGTALVGNRQLSAWEMVNTNPPYMRSADLSVNAGAASVSYSVSAGVMSYGSGPASASGDVLVTLTAPVLTQGSLRIEASSTSTATVDVGNDGSALRFSGGFGAIPSQFLSGVPLMVGPDGVDVLVSLGSSAASYSPSNSSAVTLSFEADGLVVPVGDRCGPALTATYKAEYLGTYSSRSIRFAASGAPAAPLAGFVFGFSDPAVSLPRGLCTLRSDPVAIAFVTPDVAGDASYRLTIPPSISAFELRAQFVIEINGGAGPLVFRASEGLHFRVPVYTP